MLTTINLRTKQYSYPVPVTSFNPYIVSILIYTVYKNIMYVEYKFYKTIINCSFVR